MEKYFLNITDRLLTKDQLFILGQAGFTIVEKEAIFDDEVLKQLQDSNTKDLINLSKKAVEQIESFLKIVGYPDAYIHLPIGSPAFQCVFFVEILKKVKDYSGNIVIMFSVFKKDGSFKKFIEIKPEEINC